MASPAVFQAVKDAGFIRLEASYSGGNDEGGADEVICFKADESSEAVSDWSHPMMELVNDLLSERYGSWAGDFSAHGRITVDADKGTVKMVGEESDYVPVDVEL